jgi:hypothetical protein
LNHFAGSAKADQPLAEVQAVGRAGESFAC